MSTYPPAMKIMEAFEQMRARAKLKRGQCRDCTKPLRDDQPGPFCSLACHEEWLRKNF